MALAENKPHSIQPAGGVLAPHAVVLAYRALAWTWRFEFQDRHVFENAVEAGSVFAFWHGEQLPMVYAHSHFGLLGMASKSRDGELLARIISRLGYRAVRGSSSRGGAGALRTCLREMNGGASPALAVDGPRGPWRQPQVGAVALAASKQCPIVYGVSSTWPALGLSSWDRFVVPSPFARIRIAYGVLNPPKSRNRESLESCRSELGKKMRALSANLEGKVRG